MGRMHGNIAAELKSIMCLEYQAFRLMDLKHIRRSTVRVGLLELLKHCIGAKMKVFDQVCLLACIVYMCNPKNREPELK